MWADSAAMPMPRPRLLPPTTPMPVLCSIGLACNPMLMAINIGLHAKPIEHSTGIGVVGGNRRGLGIGIAAESAHTAGLHHRAGPLKPVKDLGCCHHVAVSSQTVRQAQHRLTELVDV